MPATARDDAPKHFDGQLCGAIYSRLRSRYDRPEGEVFVAGGTRGDSARATTRKEQDIDHGLAVDIVNHWVDNRKTQPLDIDQRRILIKNLIKGFTGDNEERAILKIIENSSDTEILQIFSVRDEDAPKLSELEAEFQGE